MSLRTKIIVLLAALAALAAVTAGFMSYRTTRGQMLQAIDESLHTAAAAARGPRDDRPRPGLARRFDIVTQVLDASGELVDSASAEEAETLPVDERERQIAASGKTKQQQLRTMQIGGEEYRMLTVGRQGGGALQVARPLTETLDALSSIAQRIVLIVVGVVGAAALLGWLLGRQVTERLERLTLAARTVAATGDLAQPVPVGGRDEVGQLGTSFATMLDSLAASRVAQHQLVQDAGHELRTPLTSLRTNISVLGRHHDLSEQARAQIVADLDSETRELTDLVNELVELATERRDDEQPQPADLASIAEQVVQRAKRRSGREVRLSVKGEREERQLRVHAVERAIHNLVDNAIKFAAEGPVDVVVEDGTVAVRDRGPGLATGDETKIFNRFYRAVTSRSRPGSGLGLAIVASVAEAHGGTVFAGNVTDAEGGARIGMRLP